MVVQCVLGFDVGTSSSKGVLVSLDGAVLASETAPHQVSRPAPGHVEVDAADWWMEFLEITTRLLATDLGSVIEVLAVGVSGMGPCVLLTETDGTPVRPAILYGVDTRGGAQIDRLTHELGADDIVAVGGTPLSSQAAGPKIAWIAENEPDSYARASRLFMPASRLVWKLTGAYMLDHHSASQCWPMYDINKGSWHEPWAQLVAPGIELPELFWADDVVGLVSARASDASGLPAGIPVVAGTIDAWSEAISVDAHHTGDLMLMYGTTMFLIATVPDIVRTPSMWTTSGAYQGSHSLAGGMSTSGAITSWVKTLAGDPSYESLIAEADAAGPGSHGLLMLPYFAGERTPLLDPDARGVLAGMTLSHNRGDLYRATLEATGFAVRHNVETMRAAGAAISRVVAVGGGTRAGLWTQIVSDITGITQEIPTTTIGASYGAAYLAACAISSGGPPRIDQWNPPLHSVVPNPAVTDLYDDLYAMYRDLYPATRDVAHRLAALQGAIS